MRFRVLIEQDEDGTHIASVPMLSGCISQGMTKKEAVRNVKDAISGYLISMKKHNEAVHPSINEELVDVND